MENLLRVGWVQASLAWENPDKNLLYFQEQLLKIEADLVLLPEMFSTGFSMNPTKLAQSMNGETVTWMKQQAKQINAAICGSIIIKEGAAFYNRLIWANPDGTLWKYDKRHLFSYAGEDAVYTAGKERMIWTFKGWRVLPQVCFDLRFPVWSRNKQDYDLAIYVANWPAKRSFAWKQLLIARSIENQAFVVGVNRVDKDGNDIDHSGDSVALDPLGRTLSASPANQPHIGMVTLSKEELAKVRNRFRFLQDQDSFELL